jgi:hypothetical protein
MSCSQLYGFGKEGIIEHYGEAHNGHRGAMCVWRVLERKYLPSLPKPDWFKDYYYSRVMGMTPGAMQPIWELADDERLQPYEKVMMCTTFDHVLVRGKNIPMVIESMEKFVEDYPLESNYPEQIEILKLFLREECTAVGFNGTSVNSDTWDNAGEYEDAEEDEMSYNYLTQDDHWWMFGETKEEVE